MKPYYDEDGITIYHGDSACILPILRQEWTFDLLLTDPPYGIGADNRARILSRGKIARPRDYGESNWDDKPVDDWLMALARSVCQYQIIFGGNYYDLPPAKCWLVWDKQNGDNDFADCELAWTNLDKAVRRKMHLWNGMLRKNGERRDHPTQKPLDVMMWAIQQAPDDVQSILDPFAGSGTTGVAAKRLGKTAVLIEREERYCEIAAKRLSQRELFGQEAA